MEKKEQEIDRITRSLMKETVEQPPEELNSRIVGLLLKMAPAKKPFRIKKALSPGLLFGVLVVYMFLVAGGLMLLKDKTAGEIVEWMLFLKDLFPVFLTLAGGVSFFLFFAQLDEWLRQREHSSSKK